MQLILLHLLFNILSCIPLLVVASTIEIQDEPTTKEEGKVLDDENLKHLRLASGIPITFSKESAVMTHIDSFTQDELLEIKKLSQWKSKGISSVTNVWKQDRFDLIYANVAEHKWIFERFTNLCKKANDENGWGYEIFERPFEPIQAVTYLKGSFYGAHVDVVDRDLESRGPMRSRVCAVVLLVNDPETDYEGGRLHYYVEGNDGKETYAPSKAGTTLTWKADELFHGVTELTNGERQVAVYWVHGRKKMQSEL
ncbi:hypothetical protein CTEN210_12986 [Chaetoceros tenuissimus]|uniref:Fe2OG dioxygenase domain-containing protein n=1 Tax=Chaetoceros tenuissimus TaxID=426638 RepID=A0AAD3HAL4_9STRA|nr:hypothetical protein CTEN210_12986 [Chaetoceros tenuissimus]